MSQPAAGTAPKRAIGVVGLTFIAVSGVIGSGWLFAPLFAAQEAGPASILSWVLGGFMILIPALAFAEISAMLPVMGGIGRLPQFSHGSTVGMMIGWAAWVGYVTAAPIETQALLEYVSNEQMFSWLFVEIGETGQNPLSIPGIIVAFFLLVIFTFLNFFGVRLFTRINSGLTWFKIAVPLIAAIALLMHFDSAAIEETGFAPEGAEGILAAVASGGVIFAFLGFRHDPDGRVYVTTYGNKYLTVAAKVVARGPDRPGPSGAPASPTRSWSRLSWCSRTNATHSVVARCSRLASPETLRTFAI